MKCRTQVVRRYERDLGGIGNDSHLRKGERGESTGSERMATEVFEKA